MARLKVLYPGNHTSSGNIGADIENIVRYINSSEYGDQTLAELLGRLFDDQGDFVGQIEIRNDSIQGLQYRLGEYTDVDEGWIDLASVEQLRGTPGLDVGIIGAPLFSGRVEFEATDGQTAFSFVHNTEDAIVVYINGALQAPSTYTSNASTNVVTLVTGATLNDAVSIYKVQSANDSGYRREDIEANANQAVFPYVHTEDQKILVYRNGILQREGGTNDYTSSPASNIITFTQALQESDLVTILTVEDTSQTRITGLMTEDKFTNGTGQIPFNKLAVQDGEIPEIKVQNLTTLLANRGRMYVSANEPTGANAGDLWVDTSTSPNVLKFFNGTGWLLTSPDTGIPAFSTINALQFLRVNSTGGGLEFASVDLSSVIPKTFIGAADGVAGLDASGKLPLAQLPDTFATRSFYFFKDGSISNGNLTVTRAFKQNVRIDAVAVKSASGTANVQLTIEGIAVGDVFPVTNTLTEQNLSASIQIDATTISKAIGVEVTSSNSLTDLEVTVAAVITNV